MSILVLVFELPQSEPPSSPLKWSPLKRGPLVLLYDSIDILFSLYLSLSVSLHLSLLELVCWFLCHNFVR